MSHLPTVVLVGRTNVGKSTLFNRLLEQQKALVSAVAGTTRDWKEGNCLWRGEYIRVIDTGGLDMEKTDEIEAGTADQAMKVMKKADLILFVVDLQDEPLPQDIELAKHLKKMNKPIMVVGNKAETAASRASVEEKKWRLFGLPTPHPISAIRGTGVGDLLDLIYDRFKEMNKPAGMPKEVDAIKVAVVGKPNVGKSSILNKILGEERFITSPISHTTREPNDTLVEIDGKSYIFIDTAGMRKKAKVKKTGGLEAAGVERTRRAMRQADIVLFVVDASEPMGNQERVLAGMMKEIDAGVIMVINKWDLVEDKTTRTMKEFERYIQKSIPFLKFAPFLFVSAKSGQRIKNVFDYIDSAKTNRERMLTEEEVNTFLEAAMRRRKPIRGKGSKPPKVLGMKQTDVCPPRFELIIKAKYINQLSVAYVRFLENQLREKFAFLGTPIRIIVRTARAVSK